MQDELKNKIIILKDRIHDLTEYLQSEICKECVEASSKIEKCMQELSELIAYYDLK